MNWFYKIMGGHTHVRVFMCGAKCGELVFRNDEFDAIRRLSFTISSPIIIFIDETP